MSNLVTILDYGLGNIKAFYNIYKSSNVKVNVASKPSELKLVKNLIIPGVGSYDWGIAKLTKSGLKPYLDELAIDKKIPILGVCLGMQLMSRRSEEGSLEGLGWLNSEVLKLPMIFNNTKKDKITINNDSCKKNILPHMGWNNIEIKKENLLLKDLDESYFYFLHSYYFNSQEDEFTIAKTEYGINFVSAVNHLNLYGVQFHPEKSHQAGIKLLLNFSKIEKC